MANTQSHLKFPNARPDFFILAFMMLLLNGCVTVELPGGKTAKATEVQFVPPPRPFAEIKTSDADHAWRNPMNGNTISYLSACGSDPTLDSLRMSVIQGLDEQGKVQTKDVKFNEREAIETWADGTVDGVAIRLRTLVFKRNGCNYTLTYLGPGAKYATDEPAFNQFEQRFHVP